MEREPVYGNFHVGSEKKSGRNSMNEIIKHNLFQSIICKKEEELQNVFIGLVKSFD